MLERKNIDRVFQENLKDLEIIPNKRVWNNIEGHLSQQACQRTYCLVEKDEWYSNGTYGLCFCGVFLL